MITDQLAQFIRTTDGNNGLSAHALGTRIAGWLNTNTYPVDTDNVADYVYDINRDKSMAAHLLASKVIGYFLLP